ncbi:signal peptidase I [Rhodoferax lacus]|uniref:Signal peptidase I n=1 Tax=Rhodoferax lacus TaxID=2184758 RepID=A0A3E1R838_9BURK|nr:signal peptidase I [Rhodoferax lacus]RFO95529.1 signal peptidase I [Rhodoferax lacus]
MQALTAAILGAFVLYAGSWYLGFLEGNFALLLFLASVVTGAYWLAERFYFLPRRAAAVAALEAADAQRRAELAKMGIAQVDGDIAQAKVKLYMQPWWLDWTAGLFPVIITVFLLRSFLFEPFKIPSGSMIPTLLVGDLILVNKFTYGLRLPVLNIKITEGNKPQRGDVMVFRYPPKPSLDYIKRVVGVPGDTVAYLNKRLTINGRVQPTTTVPEFFDEDAMRYYKQYEELLGEKTHRLLNDDDRPAFVPGADKFPGHEGCSYTIEGVTCKVPEGQYFMMGDNRDNSMDSRYWGFVPERNIVGKAIFVWMNFSNPKRIGSFN